MHRLPPYRIYVPDPVSQQVGYLGVMQAEGQPVEVASRLKLQDSKISAAEQLIARGLREASLPKPCEAPCAQHCLRRENGMQATGNPPPQTPGRGTLGAMGCAAQLDTKSMRYIDSIDNRRVEIADTQAGLLFGLLQFRHSTKQPYVNIVGVPGVPKMAMPFRALELPAAHLDKISGDKVHEIEAKQFMAPCLSKTGWESSRAPGRARLPEGKKKRPA